MMRHPWRANERGPGSREGGLPPSDPPRRAQEHAGARPTPPVPDWAALYRPRRDARLDHYVDRYAARTHGMTASAIRALFAVANRPEVVSLAGGMPNIADLPLDTVGSILNEL